MSRISAAFTEILTILQGIYPEASGWSRLPNPYKPEENPEIYLRQGYGLTLGAASNTERLVNCAYSLSRSVTVVLTRKYDSLENDAEAKAATELALFEDQYALIKKLEEDVTAAGATVYTRFTSDDGIEYVEGDTDKFLMLRTEVTLEYLENL